MIDYKYKHIYFFFLNIFYTNQKIEYSEKNFKFKYLNI